MLVLNQLKWLVCFTHKSIKNNKHIVLSEQNDLEQNLSRIIFNIPVQGRTSGQHPASSDSATE
jgi:hypothetical protein